MEEGNYNFLIDAGENPLITYIIFSFNQEKYIREAIHAAFSQTYSPLEIIISDDASTDTTPDIIRSMASQYQGPHKIVVNINEVNLGIGGHVNKAFWMASGDFLVLAAGDDISIPDRTKITVDHWLKKGKLPAMIYCGADVIDADGNHTGRLDTALPHIHRTASNLIGYSHRKRLLLMGACAAYAKRVVCEFGQLMNDLGVEDIPLAVRSSLVGGIECIDKPLVLYRKNVSVWLPRKLKNETFDRHFSRMGHRVRASYKVSEQILIDLRKSTDDVAISSAKRRYISAHFSLKSLENRYFSLSEFMSTSFKTGYWRESFFPAILFGFPRIHKFAFLFIRLIRRSR